MEIKLTISIDFFFAGLVLVRLTFILVFTYTHMHGFVTLDLNLLPALESVLLSTRLSYNSIKRFDNYIFYHDSFNYLLFM